MDPFVSNSSCRGPFRIGFGAPVGLVMTLGSSLPAGQKRERERCPERPRRALLHARGALCANAVHARVVLAERRRSRKRGGETQRPRRSLSEAAVKKCGVAFPRPRLNGSAFGADRKRSLSENSRTRKLESHCPLNKERELLRGLEGASGWTVLHVRAVRARVGCHSQLAPGPRVMGYPAAKNMRGAMDVWQVVIRSGPTAQQSSILGRTRARSGHSGCRSTARTTQAHIGGGS